MVRHDMKGKGLNLCLGLFGRASIGERGRQFNYFWDSTTVFLLFDLHSNFMPFRDDPIWSARTRC